MASKVKSTSYDMSIDLLSACFARQTFTASDGKTFTDRSEYRKYEFQLSYTFTVRKACPLLSRA